MGLFKNKKYELILQFKTLLGARKKSLAYQMTFNVFFKVTPLDTRLYKKIAKKPLTYDPNSLWYD